MVAGNMIGIFDSGSGGLSVLKVLREQAPNADIVYFGDLKNIPYGNKSREELGALTVLGVQKLIDEGATEIVSACNSVSVSIVMPMFDALNLPRANLIEMVSPTVTFFEEVEARILLVATQATVDSCVYQNGLRAAGVEVESVALPELVSLIEGNATSSLIRNVIREALAPYAGNGYTHLILGCTHYPLVRTIFSEVMDELSMQATIIDPADTVVSDVIKQFSVQGTGRQRFLLSEDSVMFRTFVSNYCSMNEYDIRII